MKSELESWIQERLCFIDSITATGSYISAFLLARENFKYLHSLKKEIEINPTLTNEKQLLLKLGKMLILDHYRQIDVQLFEVIYIHGVYHVTNTKLDIPVEAQERQLKLKQQLEKVYIELEKITQ
jgi:hypothetical protein